MKRTYVLCLNGSEFTRFLFRIPEINHDINNILDQPYIHCWAPHTFVSKPGEDYGVILYGRYQKGKLYGTDFYNRYLRNKARFVADPGPEKGRGVRIRHKTIEMRIKAREEGWTI